MCSTQHSIQHATAWHETRHVITACNTRSTRQFDAACITACNTACNAACNAACRMQHAACSMPWRILRRMQWCMPHTACMHCMPLCMSWCMSLCMPRCMHETIRAVLYAVLHVAMHAAVHAVLHGLYQQYFLACRNCLMGFICALYQLELLYLRYLM